MKSRKLKPASEIEEGGWAAASFTPTDIPLTSGPGGEDLLCAHCDGAIYRQVINQGVHSIDGLLCPHCGGRNLLEA